MTASAQTTTVQSTLPEATQTALQDAATGAPTSPAEVPGSRLTLDWGQGLEWSDNPDLESDPPERDTVLTRTDLDLLWESETKVSRFGFGLGGSFETGDLPQEDSNSRLNERRMLLDYTRESAGAQLSFGARYSRARESSDTVIDDFTGDDLLVSGGERGYAELDFGIETGIGAPLGFSLQGAADQTRYYDSTSSDRDRAELDATARLQLTRTTALLLLAGAGRNAYDDEERYRSETRYVGVGLAHEFGPGLRLRTDLRDTQIDVTEDDATGARVTEDRGGAGVIVALEMDRPNGSAGLSFSSLAYDTGRRETISLSRDMELRMGELRFSLGATDSNDGLQPATALRWSHVGRRDTLTAEISQQVTSDEDSEILRQRLALAAAHELTERVRVKASIDLADVKPLDDNSDAARRTRLSVGLERDLTEDWALDLRYDHARTQQDDAQDRESNTVFLGLTARFSLLP